MELYEVMRSTFACREFTGEAVPDEVLHRIVDNARFAPSGGNRQGWRIIHVTRDEDKRALVASMDRDLERVGLGRPVRQLSRLRRKPVEDILSRDRWA